MKRQKVNDGPVVRAMVPAIDANWLTSVALKRFSEVNHDYRRYRGIVDNDADQSSNVLADLMDEHDDFS